MKKTSVIFFLFFSFFTHSQTDIKSFFALSSSKKSWVLWHPFQAKKAYKISVEVTRISDSICKTDLLDGDASGGQVDAFRHAYWMARLRQEIGKSAAKSLGKAHEKENYLMYKKNKKEDGILPDEISSEMDLYNNNIGLSLISKNSDISKTGLIYRVINAIHEGKMKIIKKDIYGNFLTCENSIISNVDLKGTWKNNKCLVSSSQISL
ncbi:MAG: hypothetical protein GW772_01480 [Flavobacteriia bacterium]|nr:hypothetical protein [Flavobacteriia bacterium]OIP47771.1 MAG: hypothetical protein AUK46_04530 [Flavobacteriaceae bacterium CG2_30_31_66]PIV97461.1 MAG: hypothetical protein COW43_03500 [Flavobacteriaceae bacterium CG17_big_fil_post_rev_8_21_14_2_50_31_13]PIX13191.1 MAG: hypothetical protein COZ74_07550 [Flavobacteriaceae bacterium CG_4_8_14_3_um_filter_31_8]PIY14820.1 MAG: hypothetical protein COZ16_07740 [Flavobacteriaceae bacterium CG_4_10_14_3_um_filter_31_253]PIZ12168.1 MAG: hypotheti